MASWGLTVLAAPLVDLAEWMLEGSLEPTFERKLLSQSNAMQRKDGGRDVTCYPKDGRVMMMMVLMRRQTFFFLYLRQRERYAA